MAPDVDMIPYRGSARSRPSANRAHVMKSTVGADFGSIMHSDGAAMRDNESWSDFSFRTNVDQRHYDEELSHNAKQQSDRRPKPFRL
jgi:hypothetical protein